MAGSRKIIVAATFCVLLIAGCDAPPQQPVAAAIADGAVASGPEASIPLSALTVTSVGGGRGGQSVVFLNSRADYRDPDNLSVMVRPDAARELEQSLGGPLKDMLDGRLISVRGEVQRVEIKPRARKGEEAPAPWFQNRIEVTSASQIVLD